MSPSKRESPQLRYSPTGAVGEYAVLLDDQCIGAVLKWERRYNLRRVIVSRGWRATRANGAPLYRRDGYSARTRREAGEALLAAWRRDWDALERIVGHLS